MKSYPISWNKTSKSTNLNLSIRAQLNKAIIIIKTVFELILKAFYNEYFLNKANKIKNNEENKSTLPNTESIDPNTAIRSPKLINTIE